VSLGLGTFGLSFFQSLAPYRPIFILLAGASLAYGHIQMEQEKMSKRYKKLIWLMTIIAVIFLFFPVLINQFGFLR
jgi:predicted permease